MGYASGDIIKYAEFAINNSTDSFRIEVFNMIISIVRSVEDAKITDNY